MITACFDTGGMSVAKTRQAKAHQPVRVPEDTSKEHIKGSSHFKSKAELFAQMNRLGKFW